MAPSQTTKAAAVAAKAKKEKKEKVFHPESRKASQIARKALRKGKLGNLATKQKQKAHSLVDVYRFFYSAIPEDGQVLSLEELHSIVKGVWLTRHDEELAQERAARRKGRPKSTREQKIEEITLQESEAYKSGMEVPDLTHQTNVDLFRRWDEKEAAFIQMLRFIRITSTNPHVAIVSRPGKHPSLVRENEAEMSVDT